MIEIKFSENDVELEDMDRINYLLTQLSTNSKIATHDHISNVMKNGAIFTARNEGVLVGMATLTFIYKPTAFFGTTEDVVVDEKFRSQGIAKSLMNQMILKAKEIGMDRIDLTSKPTREKANAFYSSIGFEKRDTNVYRLKL
ncbi:MAG: GNAT family N-acetyltransferase [Parcubacteria group bacterium]|jgi:ribosomal protein S18 acetylase RimI-like enzyme